MGSELRKPVDKDFDFKVDSQRLVVVGMLQELINLDKHQELVMVGRQVAFTVLRMALVVGRKVQQQEGTSLDSFQPSVARLAFQALLLDSKPVASRDPTLRWQRHMPEAVVHMD